MRRRLTLWCVPKPNHTLLVSGSQDDEETVELGDAVEVVAARDAIVASNGVLTGVEPEPESA